MSCIFYTNIKGIRGVEDGLVKGGFYSSIGQGSMISVYKIEPSYVTIRKHRGAPAPGAPMVPTPMGILYMCISDVFYSVPLNAILLCIREAQNECQRFKIHIGEGVLHCVINCTQTLCCVF